MLPTTPKRPPQAEISPSTMFASPPPSSSSPGLFSSPLQQQTTTPGLWGSITPQQQHQLPLGLLNLTPDPSYLMSPDAGSATAKQHCNNPQSGFGGSRNNLGDSGRRGRPRADAIHHLRNLGSNSPSDIKCKVCSRVFPREKSLQAHLRTHTGEKPYICDYPGCDRAFTQSGQLKTHQRLHAGEKPFVCSAEGCGNRYTHANRTCPVHPYHKPRRSSELILQPVLSSSAENNNKVREWLENYRRERQEKTTTTPGKLDLGKVLNTSPSKKKATPKSKRGLILEQQENVQPDITAGNQPQMQPPSSPPRKLPLQPGLHSPLRQSFPRNSAMDQGLTTPQSPLKLPLGNQPNSAAAVVKPQSPLRPHQPRDLSKGPAAAPPSPLRNQNGAALFLSRSPVKHSRSILEERLALPPSSSSPKRRLLTTTPSPSSRGNKCAGVLNPKKRWLIEVFQEQQQQQTRPHPTASSDLLAKPISWTEEEDDEDEKRSKSTAGPTPRPRSPQIWSVAAALLEMRENHPADCQQPLNLSVSQKLS